MKNIPFAQQQAAVRNLRVFLGLKNPGPEVAELSDIETWLGWALKQGPVTQDLLNSVLQECDLEVRLETKSIKIHQLFRYAVGAVLVQKPNTDA